MPTTPAADVEPGRGRAARRGQPVGSHHLLLAALGDPESAAARTLSRAGRGPGSGAGGAPQRRGRGHQRRATRGTGPAPHDRPRDRREPHGRGHRPGPRRPGPRRGRGPGRPGPGARHHPRRPAGQRPAWPRSGWPCGTAWKTSASSRPGGRVSSGGPREAGPGEERPGAGAETRRGSEESRAAPGKGAVPAAGRSPDAHGAAAPVAEQPRWPCSRRSYGEVAAGPGAIPDAGAESADDAPARTYSPGLHPGPPADGGHDGGGHCPVGATSRGAPRRRATAPTRPPLRALLRDLDEGHAARPWPAPPGPAT